MTPIELLQMCCKELAVGDPAPSALCAVVASADEFEHQWLKQARALRILVEAFEDASAVERPRGWASEAARPLMTAHPLENQPSLRQLAMNWQNEAELYFRDARRMVDSDRNESRGSMLERCASDLLEAIRLGVPYEPSTLPPALPTGNARLYKEMLTWLDLLHDLPCEDSEVITAEMLEHLEWSLTEVMTDLWNTLSRAEQDGIDQDCANRTDLAEPRRRIPVVLAKEVDIAKVLEQGERIAGLWANPEPGLSTWVILLGDALRALLGELVGRAPRTAAAPAENQNA